MYTSSGVFLLLSTLTSALPSVIPIARQASACPAPTTFTLYNVHVFRPAAGNPTPAGITFNFVDNLNSGTVCSSANIDNPSVPNLCDNDNFEWLFDGTTITVGETYSCANSTETAQVVGELKLGLFCTPSEPPIPLGYGDICSVLPQGMVNGRFTRNTMFPA